MCIFPVKISHLCPFSSKSANLDTAHLAWTFKFQTKKFNFTLQSDNGEKLYTAVVESGSLIFQPERGYGITISATTEGGKATISNLQPGISYTVVIDALNENEEWAGSATATIPSTATDVLSTPVRKTHDVSEFALINPRCACAERVTVVVSCVCLSVCMYVCPNTLFWQYTQLEV